VRTLVLAVVSCLTVLDVPSVAHAEASAPPDSPPTNGVGAGEIVGGAIAGSGALVFVYGAARWLAGSLASDSAHPFDLVGEHCDTGSDEERAACERQRSAEDDHAKTTNERNRSAGVVAMLAGASIFVAGGAILLVSTLVRHGEANAPKPPPKDVNLRVLPVETPVRYVPPPAGGGVTIVVPAIGGTW
jgi:hypothetical protein